MLFDTHPRRSSSSSTRRIVTRGAVLIILVVSTMGGYAFAKLGYPRLVRSSSCMVCPG